MINTKTYFLRNMVCNCCATLLKERLERNGIIISELKLGELTIQNPNADSDRIVLDVLNSIGLEIIKDKNQLLVEKIKLTVIELIHQLNNINSIIRKSDYLVDKLGISYQVLSKTFSQHETITLERYIILQKTEKIKELIDSGEYTLSEIAYMMDYSSVQHLSAQFRSITGLTPSEYRHSDRSMRKSIDELI
jgi:AraC family transcriptional regulator